jgi:hypothetical protein
LNPTPISKEDFDRLEKKIEAIAAMIPPGKWLTLKEAMQYAKVKSTDTIRRWIAEGHIYGFKRSGEWIVDRESIDDWYSSENPN